MNKKPVYRPFDVNCPGDQYLPWSLAVSARPGQGNLILWSRKIKSLAFTRWKMSPHHIFIFIGNITVCWKIISVRHQISFFHLSFRTTVKMTFYKVGFEYLEENYDCIGNECPSGKKRKVKLELLNEGIPLSYLMIFWKEYSWVLAAFGQQKSSWFSLFQRPAPKLPSFSYFSSVGEQLPSRYATNH